MITCSIEGDVLNMGYVIARESVSASFKVKHARPRSLPSLLGRGSARGGVGEPSQQLPPPLPSAAEGRLRSPSLHLRPPGAPGPPATGPLHGPPIGWGRSSAQAPFAEGVVCRSLQTPGEVTLPCRLPLPCKKAGLPGSAPLFLGGTGTWGPAFHRTPAT